MIAKLKRLCAQNAVELIDKGNGHYQIKGPLLVNYYPLSKTRSAYIAGTSKSIANVEPDQAVKMALVAPTGIGKTKRRQSYKSVRSRLLRKSPFCHWCGWGLTAETATIEHIIPLSRGGLNNANNMRLACEPCNKRRGSDMPELTKETKCTTT